MIDRVTRALWRGRRVLGRSELTAKLSRAPHSAGVDTERGLLIVQIDGLSHRALRHALDGGGAPALGDLLDEHPYLLHETYSGLPSSTPAVQAELFYGVPVAVPAYEFVDRRDGHLVRMSEPRVAAEVERRLSQGRRPLLQGGSAYSNVFTGGAENARFCMASLEWTDPFRTRHPLGIPALVVLHAWELVSAVVRVGLEALAAPGILLAGLLDGQDPASELKFAVSRVAVAEAMREAIGFLATLDVERGVPVVYANFIGYDEVSHRRGPASPVARHALSEIDATIGRLVRASRRSTRRVYDVWVVSDHGQEPVTPYVEQGRGTVTDAVTDALRAHGISARQPDAGVARRGMRAVVRHVLGVVASDLDFAPARWAPGRVLVAAQGPLGHVYTPRPLNGAERDSVATTLVREAGVPMVLASDGGSAVHAWTACGTWSLPDDAAHVLGADHRYLAATARELVDLCRHPDAGDLVLSGWVSGRDAVSFSRENGSHGGPGPAETAAFALVPSDTALAAQGDSPLRPVDVRRAALEVLDDPLQRRRPVRSEPTVLPPPPHTVRVLTYNVHSCIGLDNRLSPDRVAQVIARHEPDVVALQELDVARTRTGRVDQAALIADHLEMLLHFHPTLSIGEERYGDAILSRLPMRVVKAGHLPSHPRFPLEPRGAIWAEVDVGAGTTLQVINTHLSLSPLEQLVQVDALLGEEWLGGTDGGRAVLCGDFNALSWFPTCRRLARRLRDAQTARPGHRPRPTWHGGVRVGRIDHVFVDPTLEVTRVRVADDALARVASDHLPLVVDVRTHVARTA